MPSLAQVLARPRKASRQSRPASLRVQPSEQAVEGDKAGAAFEDAIKAGAQGGLAQWCRIAAIGFEIAIEPPDQMAQSLLGGAVLVGEGVELVHQPLGVDPAQRMPAEI